MNPAGRKPDRHMIDGQAMTVEEIAAMLGLTKKAIQVRRCKLGIRSYQVLVDMYRSNQIGSDHSVRHLVDGRWISVEQAAQELGVKPGSIRQWRFDNKDADGKPPTLAEAYAYFRLWQTGERRRGGQKPRVYRCRGKLLTAEQAAKLYKVNVVSLRAHIAKHGGSMEQALRSLEAYRERRAEKAILAILIEGKHG